MNTHRAPENLGRGITSPRVRLWLYGIVGALVPVGVIYGVVNADQGTAWLAVAGAVLAPAGLSLAAANTPAKGDKRLED